MPTEDTFVERMKTNILSYCPEAFIFRPNDARASGVPDLFVFAYERCSVFEAKAPTGEPRNKESVPWLQHDFSPLQVAFLKRVAATGCPAFGVIHVISTGDTWLIEAKQIAVRMTYDYVMKNSIKIMDGTEHGEKWFYRTITEWRW